MHYGRPRSARGTGVGIGTEPGVGAVLLGKYFRGVLAAGPGNGLTGFAAAGSVTAGMLWYACGRIGLFRNGPMMGYFEARETEPYDSESQDFSDRVGGCASEGEAAWAACGLGEFARRP